MELKRNLLNHFKQLQLGLEQVGAEAFMNLQTFLVEVRLQNKIYRLFPRFIAKTAGKKVYTWRFSADVIRFSGWWPYLERMVPEIGQKLKFKALLEQHGFATPPFATDPRADLAGVLVKKSLSSSDAGIRGPFRFTHDYSIDAAAGEYYEKFIIGEIVKVWFWNAQPVRMERKKMPHVTGNGRATIARLAQQKIGRQKEKISPWESVLELLAFYGKTLDTVLGPKETQIIDFRYISVFSCRKEIKEFDLLGNSGDFPDLSKVGQLVWQTLSADLRDYWIYAIDAILDDENKLWFLAANFNPVVHPSVYPLMVASLSALKDYQALRAAPGLH